MNILIIGGGGREHALAWKLAKSDRVRKIYVAPGNGGTASGSLIIENIDLNKTDELISFAKKKSYRAYCCWSRSPFIRRYC